MAVKLHRCSTLWAKTKGHPCWRVQHALDEAGVPYEIVKETPLLRGHRSAVIAGTGQSKLPAIQLEDGTWLRDGLEHADQREQSENDEQRSEDQGHRPRQPARNRIVMPVELADSPPGA